MKFTHLTPLLLFLGASISCNSKLESDNFSEKDVIGSYYFEGYASHLKRELEIVFDEDHTGYGTEYSYSTTSGNLLSAHKYVFTWRKTQNRVLLTGVSASANSDGDTGSSTSWEAEFEFKYDMFLPAKGFIDGYAEAMIRGKMKRDVEQNVRCDVTYYTQDASYSARFSSNINSLWPFFPVMYGFSTQYPEFNWMSFSNDEDIVFIFKDAYISRLLRSLNQLREREEKGETLSDSQLSLKASIEKTMKEHENELRAGNIAITFGVYIDDNIFEVQPNVTVSNGKSPNEEDLVRYCVGHGEP